MEVVPTFVEPLAKLRSFVVCRVIMKQIDAAWFVTRGQAFEEMDIGLCVKDAVLIVKETRVVQIDRAEYLLGMTLAGRGNQRLAAPPGPGLVQCRILAKTGFVLENPCGFLSGRVCF